MKPVLSIGMIFKNEIRCLERCLKSLQSLRDVVPCELVMADTGSDDGSRETAARYADVLFDFPWIDDFAAARNAVMDRCSGEWYLTIDADEWLEDITELTGFLSCRELWKAPVCGLMVRNYFDLEVNENYNEFFALRLMRLDTGARYEGAIHEQWNGITSVYGLSQTVVHHDGYVYSIKQQKNKQERNMKLLQKQLAENPEDLRTLLECVEAGHGGADQEKYVRQAAAAVEKKPEKWMDYGPPILRYAILLAQGEQMPELERWTAEMLEWFPDSIYTNIDVAYARFSMYANRQEYAQAISAGEHYLRSLAEYRTGHIDYRALLGSSLVMVAQSWEELARIVLANAYFQEKQSEKAREMLLSVDRAALRPESAQRYLRILMDLHSRGGEDLSWVMTDLWEQISQSKKREELRTNVLREAAFAFSVEYRRGETENGFNHAYTMFLSLAGKCGLGAAAAILDSCDQIEMGQMLKTVEDWEELPIVALERALLAGVDFPDRPLTLEEMDALASRLAQSGEHLSEILDGAVRSMNNSLQSLMWARGLALAAVGANKWEDGAEGFHLAKVFAEVERIVLPRCYAADMLQSEAVGFLPPMHRFGWYCVQAFDALKAGKRSDYVRLLREGLTSCPSMKPMVECLLTKLEEEQQVQALPELLRLADQIRTILAQYPADDPAVAALKQSEAYQKVAHLIEGPELDIFGGLPS